MWMPEHMCYVIDGMQFGQCIHNYQTQKHMENFSLVIVLVPHLFVVAVSNFIICWRILFGEEGYINVKLFAAAFII